MKSLGKYSRFKKTATIKIPPISHTPSALASDGPVDPAIQTQPDVKHNVMK